MTMVMPALNEEENIEVAMRSTLATFDRMGIAGELLMVDDGSTDRTGERARNILAGEPRVRIIRHEKPCGVGASFWDGVAHARGEFLCWLPGDNENDPAEIFRYSSLLQHVDFIVPFVFNKEVRSPFRNTLSFLFRLIVNLSFRVNFNYTNGTVMYRRKVLEELKTHSTNFFFTTDILVRLSRRGYLFAEVPYRLQRRSKDGGGSKAISLRSLRQVMRGYLRLLCDCYCRPAVNAPFAEGSATARARRETGEEGVAPSPPGTGGPE